ncbi:MAG: DUF4230 domain-containing protein [Crocinitomicaceae bacterium]
MRITLFIFLVVAGFISSCAEETKEPPKADVYEVKNIGLLSTSEYTIGKIIKLTDKGEWYAVGDRKILMSCKAKIKAGVDLTKIEDGDITVKGNTVTIVLPPAEMTTFVMDPKLTHTEMESVSGLRQGFSQSEKYKYMRQAERAIKRDMKDTNILKDAEQNATMFLKDFYEQMGFEEVIVEYKKAEPTK